VLVLVLVLVTTAATTDLNPVDLYIHSIKLYKKKNVFVNYALMPLHTMTYNNQHELLSSTCTCIPVTFIAFLKCPFSDQNRI
jgi:hypothetical protein